MPEKLGEAVLELSTKDKNFGRGIDRAEGKANRLEKQLSRTAKMALTAAAAVAGVFVKKSIDAAIRQERAMAGVESVIRSTGKAAGLSGQEVAEMAAEIQRATGIGDESILEMQRILLTFKRIGKDVFGDVSTLVLDMATVMGTDAKSAALQLGKALNDPARRVSELSRAGVTFSQAQIEMIRRMEEAGDVAGAQALIIAELKSQFGGAAVAARDTLGGALQALRSEFGDLQEMLVMESGGGGALRTAVEAWVRWIQALKDSWHEIEAVVSWVMGQVVGFVVRGFSAIVQIVGKTVAAIGSALDFLGGDGPWSVGFLNDWGESLKEAGASVDQLGLDIYQAGQDIEAGFTVKAREAEEAARQAADGAKEAAEGIGEVAKAATELEDIPLARVDAFFERAGNVNPLAGLLADLQKAADIQEGLKSDWQRYKEAVSEVNRLYEAGLLTLQDARAAIGQLTEELTDQAGGLAGHVVETQDQAWSDVKNIAIGAMTQAFAAIVQGADQTATLITTAFVAAGAAIGAAYGGAQGAQIGAQIGGLLGGLFGGSDNSAQKAARERQEAARQQAEFQRMLALETRALTVEIGELGVRMRRMSEDVLLFAKELLIAGMDASIAAKEFTSNMVGIRNGILGISETAEERIRREAAQFNAELVLIRARLEAQRAELIAEIKTTQAHATAVKARIQADVALIKGIGEVAIASGRSVEFIAEQIKVLDKVLEDLPNLISEDEIRAAVRRASQSTRLSASRFSSGVRRVNRGIGSMTDMIDRLKRSLDTLRNFKLDLITGAGSPVNPAEQILAVQREVSRAASIALKTGDASDFASAGSRLRDLASSLFGSGAGFQTIQRDLLAKTESLESSLGAELAALNRGPSQRTARATEQTAERVQKVVNETRTASKVSQENHTKTQKRAEEESRLQDERFRKLERAFERTVQRVVAR